MKIVQANLSAMLSIWGGYIIGGLFGLLICSAVSIAAAPMELVNDQSIKRELEVAGKVYHTVTPTGMGMWRNGSLPIRPVETHWTTRRRATRFSTGDSAARQRKARPDFRTAKRELSMQDLNRYVFRRNHPSSPGLLAGRVMSEPN